MNPSIIWLDRQPTAVDRSIDEGKDATTAATVATLNPMYAQGRGAFGMGYYHAASGLDGVTQGAMSGVDSVPIIMAMSGEPIRVGPPALAANTPNYLFGTSTRHGHE